jgi:hypothetical protein
VTRAGKPGRADYCGRQIVDGRITAINYTASSGKAPLATNELAYFKEIVTAKADDMVKKWIDYFVLHKSIDAEQINRRLK